MLVNENRFELVADRFYEAAALPELWPKALDAVAEATGSYGVALIPFPTSQPFLPCSAGIEELVDDFVKGGWAERNSRGERAASLLKRNPAAQFTLHSDADLFTSEEIARDPLHQEYLRPRGFRWFLGGFLAELNGRHAYIDLERHTEAEDYSTAERESLQKLLPDLKKAGVLALRAGLAVNDYALASLEAVGCAAALLDASGRVVRLNQAFEALCGDDIRVANGVILVADRDDDQTLQTLIRSTLYRAGGAKSVLLKRRAKRLPLIAETLPIVGAAHDVFGFGKMILSLSDPEAAGTLEADLVREVFSLTPMEVQLAAWLAKGHTVEEAAVAMRIKTGTARVYLKSVFTKTDTHRQAELVILLSRFLRRRAEREQGRDAPHRRPSTGSTIRKGL